MCNRFGAGSFFRNFIIIRSADINETNNFNLQKFIVGRETALKPDVLLVAQPTWGVDVGATAAIPQGRRHSRVKNGWSLLA